METHIRLSLAYLEGTANSIYSKQDAPSFPCHQHLLLFFSISIQSIIGSHSPGQNPDTFCDSSLSPPPVLVSSRLYPPASFLLPTPTPRLPCPISFSMAYCDSLVTGLSASNIDPPFIVSPHTCHSNCFKTKFKQCHPQLKVF